MNAEHDATVSSLDDAGKPESQGFDEQAFVRSATAKSVKRTVLISVAAVFGGFVLLAGSWVVWQMTIHSESNRIAFYLTEIVPLSEPNTFVVVSEPTSVRFPSATTTYATYRPVGPRPVPSGEIVAEFSFWGREFIYDGGTLRWANPAREFSGAQMSPLLQFLHPGPAGGSPTQERSESVPDPEQIDIEALTRNAHTHLDSMPATWTAELAVSFYELKQLDEVQALIGDGVTLNWGAVDVWEEAYWEEADIDGPFVTAEGQMVGVSFTESDGSPSSRAPKQLEEELPSRLRSVAKIAPEGTAERSLRSAAYLEANGVVYYGVVVTGPAAELRRLLDDEAVSAASLGFVVAPWQ